MAATTALIVTAAVAAGSAYSQYTSGKKAEKAQKESSRIRGNQAQIEEASKRRQQIREERIRRAQISSAAEQSGVAGGSGEIGSQGALASITGGNIASSHQADRTTQRLTSLSNRAASAQRSASTAGAVGNLAGTVFQSLGGSGALLDTFNPPTQKQTVDDKVTRFVGTSGLY